MRERIVRAVAGIIVLASVFMSIYVNINWLWVTGFVGVNLLQSSFTKFCPLELILDAVGVEKEKKSK